MQLRETIENTHTVLWVSGSILCEPDAEDLRQRLRQLVEENIIRVTIDLGDVLYINSCGLGLLIALLTTVRRVGGDLHLVRVGPHVKSLLLMTHLADVFQTFDSVDASIAGFSAET